ncbi:hypothetical protein JX265_008522 [Neoarthrinium moseri]|uniref:Uncharacterized protein n=1 Tax=Neoarthrinium moseri TaxID=1658444 RepID=A0A9Q0AMC1_9PEZI|nr:hypothetical protein JX265_008522 [Neoarthrinium moseri]
MKIFLVAALLVGLAVFLAEACPIAALSNTRDSWMVKYCDSTGLKGKSNAVPIGFYDGIASMKVSDQVKCTAYTDADCSGSGHNYQTGTFPNVGKVQSFRCSRQ